MSKKIIAFGASNSKKSINKQLADFAANQVKDANVEVLDLNDYEMPLYGIDREEAEGIPDLAHQFKAKLKEADGIVISFAEHNGAYSVAFKNVFDWISRIEKDVWYNKPMFLLATSPGGRGGQSALEIAVNKFKHMNSSPIASFSLPSFYDNFSATEGIKEAVLKTAFDTQVTVFSEAL